MAEYEEVLHGLKMLHGMGVENVTLRMNSQLVARQALGELIAKKPQILKYMEFLEGLSKHFKCLHIEQIPCIENTPIEALAHLASNGREDIMRLLSTLLSIPHVQLIIGTTTSTQNDCD